MAKSKEMEVSGSRQTNRLAITASGNFPHCESHAGLPDELIVEIFVRLPIKSVLRIQCVSKSWYTTINSALFRKKHRFSTTETKLLLSLNYVKKVHTSPSQFYHFGCSLDSIPEERTLHLAKLPHPTPLITRENGDLSQYRLVPKSSAVVGSCNGLLCLKLRYDRYFSNFMESMSDLVLWNPITKEHNKLPPAPYRTKEPFPPCHVIAFGYDGIHNDYKVIVIELPMKEYHGCLSPLKVPRPIMVYSLLANSWRHIGDARSDYWFHSTEEGVSLNGALNWRCTKMDEDLDSVFVVNLATESCGYIQAPIYNHDQIDICNRALGVLDGCLYFCLGVEEKELIEVWVLQEHRNAGSWTKWFSVGGCNCLFVQAPVWNFDNDEVLILLDSYHYYLYNPKTEDKLVVSEKYSRRMAKVRRTFKFGQFLYVPSLVSPLPC